LGLVLGGGLVPRVADPGAASWSRWPRAWLEPSALGGPSSILLAFLMASGLGLPSDFTFIGYAPVKPDARAKQLQAMGATVCQAAAKKKNPKKKKFFSLDETPFTLNAALFPNPDENWPRRRRLCIARERHGSHELGFQNPSRWRAGGASK